MSEFVNAIEGRDIAILQYYHFNNTSIKLARKGDKYFVITRKFILLHFRSIRKYEFSSYNDAEDMYLELKLTLLFLAGAAGFARYS